MTATWAILSCRMLALSRWRKQSLNVSKRFPPSLVTLRPVELAFGAANVGLGIATRVGPPSEVASFRRSSGLDAQDGCWWWWWWLSIPIPNDATKRSQLPQPPATLLLVAASMSCLSNLRLSEDCFSHHPVFCDYDLRKFLKLLSMLLSWHQGPQTTLWIASSLCWGCPMMLTASSKEKS